jgi:ureidoacrylate peracid hydrolase
MIESKNGVSRRQMLGLTVGGIVLAAGVTPGRPRTRTPKRIIEIDAKPQPISIATEETAVLVVDMQNDFGSEGGMFQRAGIDISSIREVVRPTSQVLEAARKEGIKVIYLKMGFKPDLSDAGAPGSVNLVRHRDFLKAGMSVKSPGGGDSRIMIRDTWNTDILAELTPKPLDVVLYKTRFSGFYKTELDATLQRLGIKNLIFTGCTTSVCVESTVRDAMFRDYLPILMADCMAEPIGHQFTRSNHDASLLTVEVLFGWVSSSKDLIKGLESAAGAK